MHWDGNQNHIAALRRTTHNLGDCNILGDREDGFFRSTSAAQPPFGSCVFFFAVSDEFLLPGGILFLPQLLRGPGY